MRTHKFVTDPVTGRVSTVSGPDTALAERRLEEARRECRAVISGNVAFHDDPYTPEPSGYLWEEVTYPEPRYIVNVDLSEVEKRVYAQIALGGEVDLRRDFYDRMVDIWSSPPILRKNFGA